MLAGSLAASQSSSYGRAEASDLEGLVYQSGKAKKHSGLPASSAAQRVIWPGQACIRPLAERAYMARGAALSSHARQAPGVDALRPWLAKRSG